MTPMYAVTKLGLRVRMLMLSGRAVLCTLPDKTRRAFPVDELTPLWGVFE